MQFKQAAGSSVRGFTLLEIILASAMAAIAFGSLVNFVQVGLATSDLTSATARLDTKANRVVNEIVAELSLAEFGTLVPKNSPPFSSPLINYRTAKNISNGNIVWGPPSRIEFRASSSDPVDGADNDEDGVVDEGTVVLVTNVGMPGERTRVLAQNVAQFTQGELDNSGDDNSNLLVDEPGLCFSFEGRAIHIRLTLQGAGPGGQLLSRTIETAVAPRN